MSARSADQASNMGNELFSCSEADCVASYDSKLKLQRHLDTGKHTEQLEQESTFDTIKKHWAKTVTEIATSVSWELAGRSLDTRASMLVPPLLVDYSLLALVALSVHISLSRHDDRY